MKPIVSIIMGSTSDLPVMEKACNLLNEMQVWLLRQKQTQKWNSVINTIDAVDLLLTISPDTTF